MSDFTADEQRIIDEVNTRLAPHGGVVTGFGPEAIGVMGDARRVWHRHHHNFALKV